MKFLASVALLFFKLRAKENAHNDLLRAGQYSETVFKPWKIGVR